MSETLEAWLARMAETNTRPPRGPYVEYVVDGHGHLLDPDKDPLDPVAQRMLEQRESRTGGSR